MSTNIDIGTGKTLTPNTAVSLGNRPWLPSEISTQVWLDPSDASTLTDDGGGVISQINDKSGNAQHFKATGTARPTSGVDSQNSRNLLSYNGSANQMQTDSNPFGATVSDAYVLMVINVKALQNDTAFSLTGSSTDANRWQAHIPWGSGTVYFDCGGTSGSNRLQYTTDWSANDARMMGFYCSTTDSVQQLWEAGVLKASDATGHSVSTDGNITLGGNNLQFDNCAIGEFIVVNGTITDDNRKRLEGYIAHRWWGAGNLNLLAFDHPFKYAPPMREEEVVDLFTPAATALAPYLTGWFDSADASTFTLTGTDIDQWDDKGPNGWDLVDGAGKPTYASRQIGSLNAVNFDAPFNQELQRSSVDALRDIASACFFSVHQADVITGENVIAEVLAPGGSTRYKHQIQGSKISVAGRRLDSDSYQEVDFTTTDTDPHIVVSLLDYANAECRTGVDGVCEDTQPFQTAGNTSDTQADEMGMSNRATERFDGAIAEIVMLADTLPADRFDWFYKLTGYFAWKWELVENLASDFPYKNRPPNLND